ncbi:hypothetical protein MBEHAL_2645 [Halarchaeum acidiphilum MH1-52-1]|uniref:Uncharacterized protein n=1 Tax=Halarchaeum acidiphilum MH1-52-1 TaxID=1261545 RepID=U2YXV4_9EURY|nr:hypothetical protein MBEHAL_2645 [Halarchaeum acidiphilum MH1-52-1]
MPRADEAFLSDSVPSRRDECGRFPRGGVGQPSWSAFAGPTLAFGFDSPSPR